MGQENVIVLVVTKEKHVSTLATEIRSGRSDAGRVHEALSNGSGTATTSSLLLLTTVWTTTTRRTTKVVVVIIIIVVAIVVGTTSCRCIVVVVAQERGVHRAGLTTNIGTEIEG